MRSGRGADGNSDPCGGKAPNDSATSDDAGWTPQPPPPGPDAKRTDGPPPSEPRQPGPGNLTKSTTVENPPPTNLEPLDDPNKLDQASAADRGPSEPAADHVVAQQEDVEPERATARDASVAGQVEADEEAWLADEELWLEDDHLASPVADPDPAPDDPMLDEPTPDESTVVVPTNAPPHGDQPTKARPQRTQPWSPGSIVDSQPAVEPQFLFDADGGSSSGVVGTSFGQASGWPDSSLDYAELAGCSVRAASVRGRSHRYKNQERQDSYALKTSRAPTLSGGHILYVAVCDGISQGKRSREAAQFAAMAGVDLLESEGAKSSHAGPDWDDIVDRTNQLVIRQAREALPEPEAGEPDISYLQSQMVTTCVLAVIDPIRRLITGVSIGDSSVWMIVGNELKPLTPVKNAGSDLASATVSSALPVNPTRVNQNFYSKFGGAIQPGAAVLLMSDGVGDPIDDGTTAVAREIVKQWRTAPEPFTFASQVNFASAGFDDDRTVVGVWINR